MCIYDSLFDSEAVPDRTDRYHVGQFWWKIQSSNFIFGENAYIFWTEEVVFHWPLLWSTGDITNELWCVISFVCLCLLSKPKMQLIFFFNSCNFVNIIAVFKWRIMSPWAHNFTWFKYLNHFRLDNEVDESWELLRMVMWLKWSSSSF